MWPRYWTLLEADSGGSTARLCAAAGAALTAAVTAATTATDMNRLIPRRSTQSVRYPPEQISNPPCGLVCACERHPGVPRTAGDRLPGGAQPLAAAGQVAAGDP